MCSIQQIVAQRMVFSMCCLHPHTSVVWSCHSSRNLQEVIRSFDEMSLDMALFVKKLSRIRDEEALTFHNGSSISFGCRERGFGRGCSPNVLVLDEADKMSKRAKEDMIPCGIYGLTIRL